MDRTPSEQSMLRQILVDVPRTSPDVPLFHQVLGHEEEEDKEE